MYNKIYNMMEKYEYKWKKFINENSNSPKLYKTLSQFFKQIEDQPKDLISTYKKSLANDIRLNGAEQYSDYSVEDFIEDYENYIGDKGE